ncbi:ATP-binding protein [Paucibacter soli]|uniref:ATP-binding protein n=1 Tax=Paucibacter soli TaxID=3133433 RepID=UPI0030B11623
MSAPAAPPLFLPAEERARLEQALQQGPSLGLQAQLAWALRQCDGVCAQRLAEQVEQGLAGSGWPVPAQAAWRARMQLVRAELALQAMDLEAARALLDAALSGLRAQQDEIGCADAHLLAATLAADQGEMQRAHAELGQGMDCARRAGDGERLLLLQAVQGRADAFRELSGARQTWAALLGLDVESLSPVVGAAVADLQGLVAGMGAEFPGAIAAMTRAFELSQQTGQLRRAIALASNLGRAYWGMSEFQAAMEWLTRGLTLAREAGWPASMALCMAQTGETLRRLGRRDEARAQLQDCLRMLGPHPASRTAALALKYLAHTEQDDGRTEAALQAFDALMQRALHADANDLKIDALLGRARALLALGRHAEARSAAEAGLQLAQGQLETSVDLLWILGEVSLADTGSPQQALHCYQQAIARAEAVEGFVPPPQLLEAAARAHALAGGYRQAYELSQRAGVLRQQRFTEEAGQRSLALHTHHQIERARADSEHLRQLAESEAARFQALRGTHEVLLNLSEVGRELTAELETERVLAVLERHVHALIEVDSMAVYLLDEGGTQLYCAFGMEDGQPFVDPPIALDDARSYSARCVREARELVLTSADLPREHYQVPGTSAMQAMMFAPLRVGERVIGVITVQSLHLPAYGERETLAFRSLGAYAAIALDNARAYRRLSDLQRHVMAQEKLAALGSMVAGVAHELNTPIGNSLLLASTLLGSAREFNAKLAQGALRRSDWQRFADQHVQGLEVIERSMDAAASLVRSFKQVAVDRSAEQRRAFSLAQLCEQCAQTMGLALRRAGLTLTLQVPAELRMDGYPGEVGQVLLILINNAMAHAFEGRDDGRIELGAQALGPDRLALWVADNGQGMSAAVQERVFEPFFTTKFGQGGSGLGLSICHNIVETLLGGRIRVSSEPGQGSRFTLELPLRAP